MEWVRGWGCFCTVGNAWFCDLPLLLASYWNRFDLCMKFCDHLLLLLWISLVGMGGLVWCVQVGVSLRFSILLMCHHFDFGEQDQRRGDSPSHFMLYFSVWLCLQARLGPQVSHEPPPQWRQAILLRAVCVPLQDHVGTEQPQGQALQRAPLPLHVGRLQQEVQDQVRLHQACQAALGGEELHVQHMWQAVLQLHAAQKARASPFWRAQLWVWGVLEEVQDIEGSSVPYVGSPGEFESAAWLHFLLCSLLVLRLVILVGSFPVGQQGCLISLKQTSYHKVMQQSIQIKLIFCVWLRMKYVLIEKDKFCQILEVVLRHPIVFFLTFLCILVILCFGSLQ